MIRLWSKNLFLSLIEGVVKYVFTLNPDPSDSSVTLTSSGATQVNNTITVRENSVVNWSASKSGYSSRSGSRPISSDSSKTVLLPSLTHQPCWIGIKVMGGKPTTTHIYYSTDLVNWTEKNIATASWSHSYVIPVSVGFILNMSNSYNNIYNYGLSYTTTAENYELLSSVMNGNIQENYDLPFLMSSNSTFSKTQNYVFMADRTSAYKSTDGLNWIQLSISGSPRYVIYSGNKYFIQTGDRTGYMSTDTNNWIQFTLTQDATFFNISYANGFYLLTSSGSYVYKSTDGLNWTEIALPSNQNYKLTGQAQYSYLQRDGCFQGTLNYHARTVSYTDENNSLKAKIFIYDGVNFELFDSSVASTYTEIIGEINGDMIFYNEQGGFLKKYSLLNHDLISFAQNMYPTTSEHNFKKIHFINGYYIQGYNPFNLPANGDDIKSYYSTDLSTWTEMPQKLIAFEYGEINV